MEIVVIGGGPAGVEAALTASRLVDDVTLISDEEVGTWKSALPNLWLHNVNEIKAFGTFSLPQLEKQRDDWQISLQNELIRAGVKLIRGKAIFETATTLKVVEKNDVETIIFADKFIIANGSRPIFPDKIKPDGKRIFSFQNLHLLDRIPSTIIVVGESPIGYEMVHLFQQIGSKVKWLLPSQPQVGMDKDISTYFQTYFTENSVEIIRGPYVKEILNHGEHIMATRQDKATFKADFAFITLGFSSNLYNLQLHNAKLEMDAYGSVKVNEFGQTCNPNIYIVGDANQSHSAVKAMAQAYVSTRHACDKKVKRVDLNILPLSFNEHPQVSTVGLVDQTDEFTHSIKVPYETGQFRAYMQDKKVGFLKLVFDNDNIIVGGTCIGEQAKDIISIVSLMIKFKIKVADIADFFSAHPSALEAPFTIIRRHMKC